MKEIKLSNSKRWLEYFYAPVIVMLIMLIVFRAKEIFPFGSNGIDWADMSLSNVSSYYHLYDVLHGNKSLLFDWYTGLGINMSESISILSMLSPLNLFFYFIKREQILFFMSIFTMIKMMIISFIMFVFIKKTFSLKTFWIVIFSLLYAFSGFVIQFYTNSQWLDIVALFPILILGLINLLNNKSTLMYTFLLALSLIINFYLTLMVVIFIFFFSGFYIILIVPKEQRKEVVFSLGYGTILAFGISAFIIIPTYLQIANSVRTASNSSKIQKLMAILGAKEHIKIIYFKWWMLIGAAVPLVIIIKGLISCYKNKDKTLEEKNIIKLIVFSILVVTLPLYFENINKIWHLGNYVGFPLRYGFIITFVLIISACYFITKNEKLSLLNNSISLTKNKKLDIIINIAGALLFSYVLMKVGLRIYNSHYKGLPIIELFYFSIPVFIGLVVFYFAMFDKRNIYFNYRLIAAVLLPCMVIGAYILMPFYETIPMSKDMGSDFIAKTEKIREFDIPASDIDRVKNMGNTLNVNYPFILGRPSLSNWTHSIDQETQKNFGKLGYAIQYTRLLDSGGTLFSDALINYKYTLSVFDLDEKYYNMTYEDHGYKLYENKYTIPFGITVPENAKELTYKNYGKFEYQNALFENIAGKNDLIKTIDYKDYETKNSQKEKDGMLVNEYIFDINNESILYFFSNGQPMQSISILVNGEEIRIPSVKEDENLKYPIMFNNNFVTLGSFKNQKVKVVISSPVDKKVDINNFAFGAFDVDKFTDFTKTYENYITEPKTTKNGLQINVQGSKERPILFLPVTYDKGWNAKVNGKPTEIINLYGSFIGIPLNEGENEVSISFFPKGLKIGLLISLASLLVFAFIYYLHIKKKMKATGKPFRIIELIYYLVFGAVVTIVYIIPIAYNIICSLITTI